MIDSNGEEIRVDDKIIHVVGSRGETTLRFGRVKSVREKTCTVTAFEKRMDYYDDGAWVYKIVELDRVCMKGERVMVIERYGIYILGEI